MSLENPSLPHRRYYMKSERYHQRMNEMFMEQCAMMILHNAHEEQKDEESPTKRARLSQPLEDSWSSFLEQPNSFLNSVDNEVYATRSLSHVVNGTGTNAYNEASDREPIPECSPTVSTNHIFKSGWSLLKRFSLRTLEKRKAGKTEKPWTERAKSPILENDFSLKQRPSSLNFKCLSDSRLQCSFKSLLSFKISKSPSSSSSNRNASSLNSLNDGRIPWPIPWLEAIFLPEFPNRGPLNDKQFENDGIIAQGKFSTVYKVKLKGLPEAKFAMKVQKKSDILNHHAVYQIKDELKIHQAFCHHPFIAQMYGSWQSRSHIYMVLHYIAGYGDLYEYWRFENPLPPNVVKYWAVELGSALDYIHKNGVIYRDLKMENVVLDDRAHVKLIDFGLAKWLKHGERTKTICGTLHYMAPETLTGLGYSHSADWWSLGVLLHTLVSGTYPFEVTDERKIKHFIGYRPPVAQTADLQQLLLKLLRFNPICRLTDFQLYKEEPYFNNVPFEALLTRTLSPADEIFNYQQPRFNTQDGMKNQSMVEEECMDDYMEEYTKLLCFDYDDIGPWH
uniref:Protein kinase domain-containing protein n=1 Tax=Trichuris muris TaxID=70415 RepID=A0A5S6QJ24_TRIMR